MASELESDLLDTVDWGRKWLADFNAGKTQLVSFDWSNNIGAINVKMDDLFSRILLLRVCSCSVLGLGSYVISIAKTASKKIRALIHSMKFLSPDITPYLYKSTIQPCMEYSCHV